MGKIAERLASGRRWWTAEIGLRVLGVASLAGSARIAERAHRVIMAHARTGPTPADFLLCLGGVVLLSAGLALAGLGAELFRPVPRPSRPLLP